MEKSTQMNPQEIKIQGLVDRYLASRSNLGQIPASHPDQDALAAFNEGILSEREAAPLMSHLADCGFCRHISAELVRLDLELAEQPLAASLHQQAQEPTKISEVLSNLFAKIFGTSDGAVFAHHEDEKKESDEEKKEE